MKASIVIPTFNNRELIEPCLLSLNHQILDSSIHFEVIVVDDGSTDGTGPLIASLDLNYELRYSYINRKSGSSRSQARNIGINLAQGDVIIFLDGDQVVDLGFVKEHLRIHQVRDDLAVIGLRKYLSKGKVDIDKIRSGLITDALPRVEQHDERWNLLNRFSENLFNIKTAWHLFMTCNVSVRKEHLVAVGCLDEGFLNWGLEDCELGYRLSQIGIKFVYGRNALVYHQYHASDFDEKRYLEWLENFKYFQSKHPVIEVAAQNALIDFFDPKVRKSWLSCYLRFEFAIRAIKGRIPEAQKISILEVTAQEEINIIDLIKAEAAKGNVVVIDESDQDHLDIEVQCLEPQNEILYFKASDDKRKLEIYQLLINQGVYPHLNIINKGRY